MANDTVHSARPTQSPAVSGTNCTHGLGTPIPVHVPLGNNDFRYVGDLPPSRGTGVFIPKVHEIFHGGPGGTEDGFHGNTRRGGGRATQFVCEIDEQEGAELIGIELYNHINFNT